MDLNLRQSITNQTDVSLSIASHLSLSSSSNMVFSPLSLHVVLSLIAAGSSGPTHDQILSFLRSKSTDEVNGRLSLLDPFVFAADSSGGPKLAFVNGMWVDQTFPLKPTFKEVAESVHTAESFQVDFINKWMEVPRRVNTWAEKQTNGLIKNLLPQDSVDETTRLIFANALYFKGEWTDKFEPWNTKHRDFHLLDYDRSTRLNSVVKAPFMTTTLKTQHFISTFDGFKVLRLPYKEEEDNMMRHRRRQFSMYIFLPDAIDGLPSLVERLGSQSAGILDQHLSSVTKNVHVGEFWIPRFEFLFGFEASETLQSLGLSLPFIQGGLTEMSTDSSVAQKLFVSKIFQKSFIKVDELGTEATAASAVIVGVQSACLVESKVDFVADHPFLFFIREEMTGVVLFAGHVMNPLERR